MIRRRRSRRHRLSLTWTALAVGVCSVMNHAAPPGHRDRTASQALNSAVLETGYRVSAQRVPAAPPVQALTDHALASLEPGDPLFTGAPDRRTTRTATGGPTACERDVDCDDCNPCTFDRCNVGVACQFDPVARCLNCDGESDGLFCNGTNRCDNSGTCLDVSQIKEYQCVPGDSNAGLACLEDFDPFKICDSPSNCQLLTVNPDPCRFFPDLICDEEPITGLEPGCAAPCDVDSRCDDKIACNGGEICMKRPDLGPGHGGECIGGLTPGDPCTVDADCDGAEAFCGGVCRPDPANPPPCGPVATCDEGSPITCGPGRCCTPNGNDWTCQRATLADCSAAGGLFLGVGDLPETPFDDADDGDGTCLPEADGSFPHPGESFLCPKYSAGITDGDVAGLLGEAGAAACRDYWEIGDDYMFSNCKDPVLIDTWYRVDNIRWIGGFVAGKGSRMRVSFYDASGLLVADRVTGPALSGGITRNTVVFDEKPIVPCVGYVTIKPAVQFAPDTLIEWAVTDQVQVGTTDAFVYVRRHGSCTSAPGTGCNEDADCGADGPCVLTSGTLTPDKGAPLEAIAIPGGGAALAVEIAGEKVIKPEGACCNPETGICERKLPWTCDAEGGFFQGLGTVCNICKTPLPNLWCDSDSDCWGCEGGINDGDKCMTDADCPDGTCDNGPDNFCLPVPPACKITACCSDTTAECVEVTGNQCVGGSDDGNFCATDADCAVPGFCRFSSGSCVGGDNAGDFCVSDLDCPGGTCEASCPPGFTSQGFGTTCDPNCCPASTDEGADTCNTAPILAVSVPTIGQPPVTYTLTSNNKAATFGDRIETVPATGTCAHEIFSEVGITRDRGWWHAFEITECADVRIDLCCTEEIAGQAHQPQWEFLFADCDPCTRPIHAQITGPGSYPDSPIGTDTASSGAGAPFCSGDDPWYTFRHLEPGDYYIPVFTGSGGHFGEYQLHITASACQEAACCLPESVCVGGPLNGDTCATNDECAPLKGDKVCVGDSHRPNELCCPDGGACDNDPVSPTCVGGTRDTLPCCSGGGECKGNCTAGCALLTRPECESLDGYWMGFGNIPLGTSPTLTCDTQVCETGSCCLAPGDCRDDADPGCTPGFNCCADAPHLCINRKQCEQLGGEFTGGGQCENPAPPCPACDFAGDGNCHLLDGVNYALMSDLAILPNGVLQADDLILSSPQVDQVCVWGVYFDPVDGPDDTHSCAGQVMDQFRVRFYADDGNNQPDNEAVLYDSFVATGDWLTAAGGQVAKTHTQDVTATTGENPLTLQAFTLTFPTADLPTGVTIWLEVANNTDTPAGAPFPVRNSCYWHWIASYPQFGGDGNSWSVAGSEWGGGIGASGYLDVSGRWEDLVFCLGGPSGPVNFTDPPTPTGACCDCIDTCVDGVTLEACNHGTPGMERRWMQNTVCPESCLPIEGVPGDDTCTFSANVTASGQDCTPPPPLPVGGVQAINGLHQLQTLCAGDSLVDPFEGNSHLGGDIFRNYTSTCTGELVINMCSSNIEFGNMDSFIAVYHDFDFPANCPCISGSADFNVAHSDEGCNGESDGGAGLIDGIITFPGECWMVRIGGWGATLETTHRGRTAVDIGCVQNLCPESSPPELQRQFAGNQAPEPKSRYISVTAGDPGRRQTIRVTWDAMPPWPGGHAALTGQTMFMKQPIQVCEGAGQGLAAQPPNCGASPGMPQRWLWAAELTCDPTLAWFGDLTALSNHCTGSGESCTVDADCAQGVCGVDGVIHLWSPAMAPSRFNANPVAAQYTVQVIEESCLLTQEWNYSDPLVVETAGWGDVGAAPLGCPFPPPNGTTDLIPDVTEAINKFSNAPCAPKKTRCDMDHDFQINFPTDVLMILNAFSAGGGGFLEPAPAACGAAAKVTRGPRRQR